MANQRIYLSSPDVTQLEEDAVVRAMRSGWIAPMGPEVNAFEEELSEYCGRSYAVALSSGTAALHLGLLTLGIGPGDFVLTSSMTFTATTNAITYTGAEPIFVDSDYSGNMDPDLLEEAFATLQREGKRVRAVVPVDLLGKVADHPRIQEIAERFGAVVLSDAAESLGAVRNDKSAAAFGTAAIVSFNGNKIMTTSGGGALLTDDKEFADHIRYLATQARRPVVHYEHTDIGYNYRLSNILAALGRAQLTRLDSMIERRAQHRNRYREFFKEVKGVSIFGDEPESFATSGTRDNFWLSSILIDPESATFTSSELMQALSAVEIEARPLWKPMHLQPVHQDKRAFVNGTSQILFETGVSLPSGSALGEEELSRIFETLDVFLQEKK